MEGNEDPIEGIPACAGMTEKERAEALPDSNQFKNHPQNRASFLRRQESGFRIAENWAND